MNEKKRLVCFGGGTGMPALLSGLKNNPWFTITACVNMFDNGKSSGQLRDRFNILPPGDVFKCLLALSEYEEVARAIFLKRIKNHEHDGHTGGNIMLLGLETAFGNYLDALNAFSQMLSVRGTVIPITLEKSHICAEYTDGSFSSGEVSVDQGMREGKTMRRLFLDPPVRAHDEVGKAIYSADAICIGPGSLYTSVLPNFLPVGVAEAIRFAKARFIYIANLLTEGPGMQKMCLAENVAIVEEYVGRKMDYILVNAHWPTENDPLRELYANEGKYPILPPMGHRDLRIILRNFWTDPEIARHDGQILERTIACLL